MKRAPRTAAIATLLAIGALAPPAGAVPHLWGTNGDVDAVVESDGILYLGGMFAGGSFTTIGGQARNGLAAIDALTGSATSWDPMASAFSVDALALDGSALYVGGTFTDVGGQPRSNAAVLHAGTAAAGEWDPAPASTIAAVGAGVHAISVSGSSVHVGGTFMAAEGEPVAGIFASSAVATAAPLSGAGGDALRLRSTPNPFGAATTLRFTLPEAARVRVEIFDVAGRRVGVPVRDAWMEEGAHALGYRGAGLPAGMYFCRIRAGGRVATDRLLIVR